MKDHEKRELIDRVTAIATEFADTQQLRARIASVILPALEDKVWFLLYDGTSVDGTGPGEYVGRTTDVNVAKKHWKKTTESPYCTGKVVIVTDTKVTVAWRDTNWSEYGHK